MWELAKEYDVDFEELKQLNSHLSSPDMIMPGMKIKIPSTKKSVKKEGTKEMGKKDKMTSYKDISPKPMPVLKEDDNKEKKMPMPEFPAQSLPKIPVMPFPADYGSKQQPAPEVPQTPKMKQEVKNYTTIHLPQSEKMDESSKPSKPAKKTESSEKHGSFMNDMGQHPYMPSYSQPGYQQMPPMIPVYYPVYQPVPCPPMPMFDPMPYQQGPPMNMPLHDCGCGGTPNDSSFQFSSEMFPVANPSYMEAHTAMPSLPQNLSANFFNHNGFAYREDRQNQTESPHFSSENNEDEISGE